MEVNEKLHGFILKEKKYVEELKAEYHRFTYEKNGADLVWLKRDDRNKTFAITFKTIPTDDTGVFHILEHSVLCGSEKYPVKEPFVELIKSSLQTFINAFTYPDKTMYPVCSRNDKDFLNLMDVYLDAVLHPTSVKSELAFLQEGWHYEPDENGGYKYNGVVFNEMKGSFANYERVLDLEMDRQLFPDNCYSCESGGLPEHIPDLTYESYLENHRKYYHPSNSRIFLDGDIDADAVFGRIDSFLKEYDYLKVDSSIPLQSPVSSEKSVPYEIGEDEDGTNKYIVAKGWVAGGYDSPEKNMALSVLMTALCDSNESPVKKALLDKELCEDAELYLIDELQQNELRFVAKNTSADKKDEILRTLRETLEEQSKNGLDRERLHALFNRYEYTAREKDYGSYPRGLIYAMQIQDSWLYGGDPLSALVSEPLFDSLRKKIDEGYFEKLIDEAFLSNKHTAEVTLIPSTTLGKEKREKEAARVARETASFSEEKKKEIADTFERLRKHQNEDDRPEDIAKLPVLPISDVDKKAPETKREITKAGGRTLIHAPLDTDGIIYVNLFFDISDVPLSRYGELALFTGLLGDLATEKYSPTRLANETDGKLGAFDASVTVMSVEGEKDGCRPYLCVSYSLLESKKDDALPLIDEILNNTKFDDVTYVGNLIRQERIAFEQKISMSGNAYASRRAGASFNASCAVTEKMAGIESLRWLQDTDDAFKTDGKKICESLASDLDLFSSNTLTLSVTGPLDREWLEQTVALFGERRVGEKAEYKFEPKGNEGFIIPAEIGFGAMSCDLDAVGESYTGVAAVASKLLTYGYLWNTIRVKGGAYGTRLAVIFPGDYRVSSYRDPDPGRSLGDFAKVGEALREFVASDEKIDKYIISTIADVDPLLTPRMEGYRAALRYLSDVTDERTQKSRDEILSCTKSDLEKYSRVLDALSEKSVKCVIGGKNVIEKCGNALDKVEPVVAARDEVMSLR